MGLLNSEEKMAIPNAFVSSRPASGSMSETVDLKLEVIVIPVADVNRSKEFYTRLGWRLDADFPLITGFALCSSRLRARGARFSLARR